MIDSDFNINDELFDSENEFDNEFAYSDVELDQEVIDLSFNIDKSKIKKFMNDMNEIQSKLIENDIMIIIDKIISDVFTIKLLIFELKVKLTFPKYPSMDNFEYEIEENPLTFYFNSIINRYLNKNLNLNSNSNSNEMQNTVPIYNLITYIHNMIENKNLYCPNCCEPHPIEHPIQVICNNDKCKCQISEIGITNSVYYFIQQFPIIFNILTQLAKEAIKDENRFNLFEEYFPEKFKHKIIYGNTFNENQYIEIDREDQLKKLKYLFSIIPLSEVILNNTQSWYENEKLLNNSITIPQAFSKFLSSLDNELEFAIGLIINMNRSFIEHVSINQFKCEIDITKIKFDQNKIKKVFKIIPPPERYIKYNIHLMENQSNNKFDNVLLAWHGSSAINWWGIITNGLQNLSGTKKMANAAAYGNGIYLAPFENINVSIGYSSIPIQFNFNFGDYESELQDTTNERKKEIAQKSLNERKKEIAHKSLNEQKSSFKDFDMVQGKVIENPKSKLNNSEKNQIFRYKGILLCNFIKTKDVKESSGFCYVVPNADAILPRYFLLIE